MLISVSQIKRYMECPAKAHYEYTLHRGGLRKSEALELGSLVHIFFDAVLSGKVWEVEIEEALAALEPIQSVELSEAFDILRPALELWKPQDDWRVVSVEQELQIPCGSHTLVGRLDGIVEWNGGYWHLQHKTLGATVPVGVYCEQQRTDWHESVYHRMAESAGYRPFLGTILNIVRKLSAKAVVANPASSIVPPQYLPRTTEDVDGALSDLEQTINDIADPTRRIVKNRCACAGPYRNSLCEFKPVCDGDDTLDSPNYRDLEIRYAPN